MQREGEVGLSESREPAVGQHGWRHMDVMATAMRHIGLDAVPVDLVAARIGKAAALSAILFVATRLMAGIARSPSARERKPFPSR